MKLSQAVAKERDLTVEFDGAVLNVKFRPLTYTVRQVSEMQAKAREGGDANVNQVVTTIKRMVVGWDLTDDDEVPIPLDHPYADPESETPADDDPLRDVPMHIFSGVLQAVAEAQAPSGEASRPSPGR